MIRTREEMKGLRQDLIDLRSTVKVCGSRLYKMEETVRDIQVAQKSSSGTNPDFIETIRALEENVQMLHWDLNERDQDLLSNEIELSCVPEEGGENPIHIVLTCTAKLGMQIDVRDLVSCARVDSPPRARVETALAHLRQRASHPNQSPVILHSEANCCEAAVEVRVDQRWPDLREAGRRNRWSPNPQ